MSAARTSIPGPGARRSTGKGVLRQSGLTGVIAMVAVVSGLVLDLFIAASFGAGRDTDAFVVAARLPMGLAAVVMVVANQVLVPSFTAWSTTVGRRTRRGLESATLLLAVGVMVLLAGALALLAHPVASVMAPGFDDQQTKLAAELIRVMVWYLPCVAAAEVLRCWLNSRLQFAVPAAMTLVLNVVAVSVILLAPAQIETVVWAYVCGSAAELLVMSIVAHAKGFRPIRPNWRHPEIRRTAGMCLRPGLGAGLNPLVRVVELFFASFLPSGSATILHYGNRLASAVGGTIVFRSVMVALLPRLTRAWSRGARPDFDHLVRLGLRIMLMLAIPMGVLGAVLAPQATVLVFGIGEFDAESAALLGSVLAVYALSFPGSGLQRALLAPAYARRDTKTPWRNTVYGVVANLVLLPVLVLPFGGDGAAVYAVAAAYAVAQYVNVLHAWWRLQRTSPVDLSPLRADALRGIGGSLAGAIPAIAIVLLAHGDLDRASRAAVVTAALLAGLLAFAAVVLLTSGPMRRTVLRRAPGLRRMRRHDAVASDTARTTTDAPTVSARIATQPTSIPLDAATAAAVHSVPAAGESHVRR